MLVLETRGNSGFRRKAFWGRGDSVIDCSNAAITHSSSMVLSLNRSRAVSAAVLDRSTTQLQQGPRNEEALVRLEAAVALEPQTKHQLVIPLLEDDVRAVRIEATSSRGRSRRLLHARAALNLARKRLRSIGPFKPSTLPVAIVECVR